jgi:hypothetical protein
MALAALPRRQADHDHDCKHDQAIVTSNAAKRAGVGFGVIALGCYLIRAARDDDNPLSNQVRDLCTCGEEQTTADERR